MSFFNLPAVDISTTGRRFQPPRAIDTPLSLFIPQVNQCSVSAPRFIRRENVSQFLILTDGACLNNGFPTASAGGAFVFRPATSPREIGCLLHDQRLFEQGACKFRLSNRGPNLSAPPGLQTSNRAELTAVLLALQFRVWVGEGFRYLVIATDSTYVVDGSAAWVHGWRSNGWRTASGQAVKNRDSWEELLEVLAKLATRGLKVSFWRIPRELNGDADRMAKLGAALPEQENYVEIVGMAC